MNRGTSLRLSDDAQVGLVAGALDAAPVRGLTHGFYKYPARFSPAFAAAAIKAFTHPGDMVLDPHVGGGTTLVEAIAAGREAVGVDISTLAEFVTGIKCTVFSEAELKGLERWASRVAASVNIHKPSTAFSDYADLGYYKHLNNPSRWRLRKAIEQSLASAIKLGTPRLEAFGRCVVLRTAQWLWMVEASTRLLTISAASFVTPRSTWCAVPVSSVHLQKKMVGRRQRFSDEVRSESRKNLVYAQCALRGS
jgi:hypothetical protein